MGEDDLGSALSETRGVLHQAGVRVRVVCCDAAATAPRVVRPISDVTLTGGGGTDLRVGIDAALAARLDLSRNSVLKSVVNAKGALPQ